MFAEQVLVRWVWAVGPPAQRCGHAHGAELLLPPNLTGRCGFLGAQVLGMNPPMILCEERETWAGQAEVPKRHLAGWSASWKRGPEGQAGVLQAAGFGLQVSQGGCRDTNQQATLQLGEATLASCTSRAPNVPGSGQLGENAFDHEVPCCPALNRCLLGCKTSSTFYGALT